MAKLPEIAALKVGLTALAKLVEEREDRTKERFTSMERGVSAALAASDKAGNKAETATEKRFDSVNEFRETLADQAALLLPRAEYMVQHSAVVDRVSLVERRLSTIEDKGVGKREGLSLVGQVVLGIISVISASAAAIGFALHH